MTAARSLTPLPQLLRASVGSTALVAPDCNVLTAVRFIDAPARRPSSRRHLANVRDDGLLPAYFVGHLPRRVVLNQSVQNLRGALSSTGTGASEGTGGSGGTGCNKTQQPPDQRTLKLGKTVSVLHDRLPTLLASPLPSDILSPQISLLLFPSTHPHLPTVSGRIAYLAALWTAPVAWGRVPVVGNVKLVILSERMVKNGCSSGYRNERLIVRWRTCGKTKGRGMGGFYRGIGGSGDQVDKITEFLGGDVRDDEEFSGLFIFEFDEEGRIVTHTIEHAQEGGNWEKMTRVVSVTDWLLGLAKRSPSGQHEPGLASVSSHGGHDSRR